MFRAAGSRSVVSVLLLVGAAVPLALAADGGVGSRPSETTSYILVGFVGGFVRHTNPHHGPVELAQRIREYSPKNAYIEVFENRHRKSAYNAIVHLLDSNRDGVLSSEEKMRAHVILFGQSWGASAVVMLARDLDRAGIPVMLTVQVDSVAKPWQHDGLIPDNVAAAANFYQTHGIIHGRSLIRAADDSKTQILGNYRFDYRQNPISCKGMSWIDRAFTPGHMQSECDPHLWDQVETLVRQRLRPELENVAGIR